MMKKKILILALGSFSLVGSCVAMNLDDLSCRILADVPYAERLTETAECVRKDKAVLTHVYKGSSLFTHITALYDTVKAEMKSYDAPIRVAKEKLAKSEEKLKRLKAQVSSFSVEMDKTEVAYHIGTFAQELNELVSKQNDLNRQIGSLKDAFEVFVALGKGDDACEKSMPALMAELELKKKMRKPLIAALYDVYPDLFPNKADETVEEEEKDEKEEDGKFIYTPMQSLLNDIATNAFRYQRHLGRLNAEYSRIQEIKLSQEDLCERDLQGVTLVRRIAERWYSESPKTEEERKGGYSVTRGGLFGMNTYWRYYDPYYHKRIAEGFEECLNKGASYPVFVSQLNDLMDCFLENEQGYKMLIDIFEAKFPGKLAFYRFSKKVDAPVVIPPASPEKISAYYAADLFCALFAGDDQLTNAFEMIQENPELVNACTPDGMPVLYQVIRMYPGATDEKKKRYALFFDYLLANGADYKKTYVMKTTERVYVSGYFIQNTSQWVNGQYTTNVKMLQLSVEEVLDDYMKDFQTERAFDPYRDYDTGLKNSIDQDTALFFKNRLDAFKADPRAPFKGREGEWLEEMMPTPPVAPAAQAKKEQKAEAPDDTEDMDELLKNYTGNSFWETWKTPLKYFTVGVAVAGIGYWLKNRSWGDPYEDLRKKRDLLRSASARAA